MCSPLQLLDEAAALRLVGVTRAADALRRDKHLKVRIVRLAQPLLAGGSLALLACQRLLLRDWVRLGVSGRGRGGVSVRAKGQG